jgi:integrase
VVTLLHEDGTPLPANASQHNIIRAYQRQVTASTGHTLGWLIDKYLDSPQFAARAETTRRAYKIHAETIKQHQAKNGRVCGDAPLRSLNPPFFSKYRDRRSEAAPISANRELQFIRAVFSWGIEYGHCQENPAKGVRLNPSQSRDRYVEDWEMELVQGCGSDMLAVVMELAYLLRARVGEVLALRRADIGDTGVYVRRTKGSNSEVTRWSERLREAVSAALSLHKATISPYLLHGADGQPLSYPAVRSAFARALKKAQDEKLAHKDQRPVLKKAFTVHDLKAKGITDHKHHHGGHRSARMREVYVRKAEEVDSTR